MSRPNLNVVHGGGILKLDKSYNFVDKRPIIDQLRGVIGDDDIRELADKSRVGRSTIHNWLNGKTISPRVVTINAVLYQYGLRLGVVDL